MLLAEMPPLETYKAQSSQRPQRVHLSHSASLRTLRSLRLKCEEVELPLWSDPRPELLAVGEDLLRLYYG